MKLLSDLIGTDYGFLSLVVIAAMVVGMIILALVAMAKIRGTGSK